MKKTTSAILQSYDDPIRSAKLPTSVYKIMTWFGPQARHHHQVWHRSRPSHENDRMTDVAFSTLQSAEQEIPMDPTTQTSGTPGSGPSPEDAWRASAQPMRLARAVLHASRHGCAFFHSRKEILSDESLLKTQEYSCTALKTLHRSPINSIT